MSISRHTRLSWINVLLLPLLNILTAFFCDRYSFLAD